MFSRIGAMWGDVLDEQARHEGYIIAEKVLSSRFSSTDRGLQYYMFHWRSHLSLLESRTPKNSVDKSVEIFAEHVLAKPKL